MSGIDWSVVGIYLVGTLALGLVLARRASGSLVDYFVGGRALPWWLAGTSMAATTFSIDTPLYVTGVVGTRGIAGNWEWWNFAISHVILIYIFARLWRRAEIITDAELTELRYGGRPAAVLRGVKSFLFAVVINSVGIGLAMLAMVKVLDALGLFDQLVPLLPVGLGAEGAKIWLVVLVTAFVVLYAGMSGLWGVVVTDFLQFFLALFGAIVVAVIAVDRAGGLRRVVDQVQSMTEFDLVGFTPFTFGEGAAGGLIGMSSIAGISASTFFAYTFVQWWSFRRSDGGGEFVQRLAAAKDEAEAEKAAWFFNVLHYIVRTWPWVIVAIVALQFFPDLEDRELGYPLLMIEFLPVGVLGLVVASLIAAFMSTVSTLINWGASYLTNDLYARFLNRDATQAQLVLAGRLASIVVAVLGALVAFYSDQVMTIFRLILAIGTGPGLVLILRWFWWRINAWAELAAMLAGFLIGVATTYVPALQVGDFGVQLMIITLVTTAIWVPVMFLTRPEEEAKLESFYLRVRPGGPGWARIRERTGVAPAQDLGRDILRVLAALLLLFGLMFLVGGVVLLRWWAALGAGITALIGWFWLRALGVRSQRAEPLPEPPTHPSGHPR